MFFLDDQFIFSASDLSVCVDCNYQSLYLLDVKLGLRPKPDMARDEMLERTAVLGDAHEQNVLKELIATYGDYDQQTGTGVKQFADRPQMTPAGLRAAHEATMDVLRNGADVIFQATFFDGSFVGFADFLVRQPDGTWAVWDTKLARHARVSALLQIAAYADQMLAEDIPCIHLRQHWSSATGPTRCTALTRCCRSSAHSATASWPWCTSTVRRTSRSSGIRRAAPVRPVRLLRRAGPGITRPAAGCRDVHGAA